MKKFKFILTAAMLVNSVALLAGCNDPKSSSDLGGLSTDSNGNIVFNDVSLRVWSVIGSPDNAYLDRVNNAFNDYYRDQGIQAEITSIVNGDYYTQLANVINTDPEMAPDVVIFHSERLTQLAESKIIIPLENYFSLANEEFSRDEYLSNVIDECYYNNQLYGVPLDVHAGVWFVRSDILAKNGLQKPTSLSEFKAVCNQLIKLNNEGKLWTRAMDANKPAAGDWVQKKVNNFYPIVMSDTGGIENGWIPQTAVFQNGGKLTDENGKPAWNTQGLKDVMSMFRDWQSGTGYEGVFVGPNNSAETVWTNIANGSAIFSCEGPWWIEDRFNEYERVLGEKTDSEGNTYQPLDIMNMQKLYALDESKDYASHVYGVGHCFAISKTVDTNEKRAAAAIYAKYMTQNAVGYMQGGHLPASKAILESKQYLESSYYNRYLKEFGNPENFVMLGNTPHYEAVYEKLKLVYVDTFSKNKASMSVEDIVNTRYNEALQLISSSDDL